jgi:hypothetical protein
MIAKKRIGGTSRLLPDTFDGTTSAAAIPPQDRITQGIAAHGRTR